MLLGINSTRKDIDSIALLMLLIPNSTVTRAITHTYIYIYIYGIFFLLSTVYNTRLAAGIGKTVVLECKYRTYGFWIFENGDLPNNAEVDCKNILTIHKLQIENTGTYACHFQSILVLEVYGGLMGSISDRTCIINFITTN